jgi:topoisomerase IA-like protein
LGKHQGKPVNICKGKYGIYIKYNDKNVSLYGLTENEITLEKVVHIIDNGPPKNSGFGANDSSGASASSSKPSIIKTIDDTIKIKNGKYGAYIEYRNPKSKSDSKPLNVKIYGKKKPEEFNKEDCMVLIKNKLNKMK